MWQGTTYLQLITAVWGQRGGNSILNLGIYISPNQTIQTFSSFLIKRLSQLLMNEVLLSSRAVYHFMFSNWRSCKSLWKTMQFTYFSMEIIICYFSFVSVPGATCTPSCLFLPRDPVILPENVTADTMDHRLKPTKVQVKRSGSAATLKVEYISLLTQNCGKH